jgi:catechol 2,3-dioxygenase-like lactoylglutathione lyase family enzyme
MPPECIQKSQKVCLTSDSNTLSLLRFRDTRFFQQGISYHPPVPRFSHVVFGVNDLEKSKKFYDALLGTLGIGPGVANKNRYFYRSPTGTFGITTPIDGAAATQGNGSTIEFTVQSAEPGETCRAVGSATSTAQGFFYAITPNRNGQGASPCSRRLQSRAQRLAARL